MIHRSSSATRIVFPRPNLDASLQREHGGAGAAVERETRAVTERAG
jgi:hypothetical protein